MLGAKIRGYFRNEHVFENLKKECSKNINIKSFISFHYCQRNCNLTIIMLIITYPSIVKYVMAVSFCLF